MQQKAVLSVLHQVPECWQSECLEAPLEVTEKKDPFLDFIRVLVIVMQEFRGKPPVTSG
jgi:hypothetical protein